MAETTNENGRGYYNNEVLCKAAGGSNRRTLYRIAADSGVSHTTVRKVLVTGSSRVRFDVLMKIIEATGADYGKVFDPKFYRANKPGTEESN